jgi:type IX secretion system PorP/SprF family membrane protein
MKYLNTYKLLILILCLSCQIRVEAQQRVHFTQYMVNQYVLNPAAGGIGADLDINFGYRKQWLNFKGGPLTYYFSGHMPIKERNKPVRGKIDVPKPFHSAGAFIFKDQTGPISKTSALASYSYNIPLSKGFRLAMGAFVGMMQLQLDQSQLKFDELGETVNYSSKTLPDGSAGLWLYNNYFYIGTSVNQLFYNSLNFYKTKNNTLDKANLVYHYYTTAGVKIPLGYEIEGKDNHIWYIIPSTMIKYGGFGTPVSFDFNTKLKYRDHFWLGGSYRVGDAFAAIAGVKYHTKNSGAFEFSYSYDYTTSKITKYTSGSHEIIMGYSFKVKPSIICPGNFW